MDKTTINFYKLEHQFFVLLAIPSMAQDSLICSIGEFGEDGLIYLTLLDSNTERDSPLLT